LFDNNDNDEPPFWSLKKGGNINEI
jgi:hypothetical protein